MTVSWFPFIIYNPKEGWGDGGGKENTGARDLDLRMLANGAAGFLRLLSCK